MPTSKTASVANESEFRVVKSGTCPSLSGKSKLTYEIASGPANDLHVRIAKNSGGGYFSTSWVAWDRLQSVLDKNGAKPITCHTLGPLFKGLSVNTSGFLLAVLKHEGLVQPHAEVARCYERTDLKTLRTETKGAKAVKPVARPSTAPKKAPKKP